MRYKFLLYSKTFIFSGIMSTSYVVFSALLIIAIRWKLPCFGDYVHKLYSMQCVINYFYTLKPLCLRDNVHELYRIQCVINSCYTLKLVCLRDNVHELYNMQCVIYSCYALKPSCLRGWCPWAISYSVRYWFLLYTETLMSSGIMSMSHIVCSALSILTFTL